MRHRVHHELFVPSSRSYRSTEEIAVLVTRLLNTTPR